jgi:hypothetical protein
VLKYWLHARTRKFRLFPQICPGLGAINRLFAIDQKLSPRLLPIRANRHVARRSFDRSGRESTRVSPPERAANRSGRRVSHPPIASEHSGIDGRGHVGATANVFCDNVDMTNSFVRNRWRSCDVADASDVRLSLWCTGRRRDAPR